eukprot:CAMPEP_0119330934 /NCGR_PEP_ID=MMETSP1333-20130426/79363_1 /TAXON_ID=418940 /ORGANISM="Scyphosphaera apsteinii, Strain RCC1455" /LENGTH=38 /DNA_ID= /DNA_START= /DNA_END= /DNA_ORIENTATION=
MTTERGTDALIFATSKHLPANESESKRMQLTWAVRKQL